MAGGRRKHRRYLADHGKFHHDRTDSYQAGHPGDSFRRRTLPGLADIEPEPYVHVAGGVDLQVKVEYLPLGSGRDCGFDYHEPLPPGAATQPYYVRLTQSDGNRAWSSPFYLTRSRP